ncbi:MAG: hypothetical protein A3K77_06375 [Euryarchaeota archaeon RBG_13_31_8]|nr:MAG: hypothetical protein A3K77_06375 [Euryarchaeota archaeon RBG_13_31_8]
MKGAKKMVITLSEAKTLNQISVSTYDTLINMLIPIVEDSICNYCNNHFVDSYKSINNILPTVYYYSNTCSFDNTDNSLNDSAVGFDFTTLNFKITDTIRIYNSISNDGPRTIKTISAAKIILESLNTVYDEIEGNTIVIARVTYPQTLKLVAASMVKYLMVKQTPGFKSETLYSYSYTKESDMVGGYPKGIMDQLNDYRSIYLKTIPFNLQYFRQV